MCPIQYYIIQDLGLPFSSLRNGMWPNNHTISLMEVHKNNSYNLILDVGMMGSGIYIAVYRDLV